MWQHPESEPVKVPLETLSVVIPVYNEEGAIETVIEDWHRVLSDLQIDAQIHVYNDGSRDGTLATLTSLQPKYSSLVVHTKPNSGHGPTILQGYLENLGREWIFQVDSDNELRADSFPSLWSKRASFDFLIGIRDGRNSPLPRRIISVVSRITVHTFYGRGVSDVNSPFRLMRTEKFKEVFERIPRDTFAPNLIISAEACCQKMRIFEMPVAHFDRQTGEVSIKKWRLLKAAIKSFAQTIQYRFSL